MASTRSCGCAGAQTTAVKSLASDCVEYLHYCNFRAVTWLIARAVRPAPVPLSTVRMALLAPQNAELGRSIAVSPDGRWLAFVASSGGRELLWVRALNGFDSHLLGGTEDASLPFWSPDSQGIGFFAGGKLKRTDVSGTAAVPLADAYNGRGGTWAPDGTILFAPGFSDELYRIPASGGDAKRVTTLDRRHTESAHLWPSFLPDGKHFFLCVRAEKPEFAGVFVGSLDSSERIRVLESDSNAQYAKPGVVLFAKGDGLMAQPFDASTFKTQDRKCASPSACGSELEHRGLARLPLRRTECSCMESAMLVRVFALCGWIGRPDHPPSD